MARMIWSREENVWIKACVTCGTEFRAEGITFDAGREALSKFFHLTRDTYDQLNSWCRSCKSIYSAGRSISDTREAMIKEQQSLCYLCQNEIAYENRTANVDHCHTTGKTRKVLCLKCNQRMAGVDDEEWLAKAIAYRDLFRCE